MTATPDPGEVRPRPLRSAAARSGTAPALGGTTAVAILIVAVLSREQVDTTTLVMAIGAIAASGATVLLTVLRTVRSGERLVTPNSSPRGPDGEQLVPRTQQDLGQVLIEILAQLSPVAHPPADPAAEAAAAVHHARTAHRPRRASVPTDEQPDRSESVGRHALERRRPG